MFWFSPWEKPQSFIETFQTLSVSICLYVCVYDILCGAQSLCSAWAVGGQFWKVSRDTEPGLPNTAHFHHGSGTQVTWLDRAYPSEGQAFISRRNTMITASLLFSFSRQLALVPFFKVHQKSLALGQQSCQLCLRVHTSCPSGVLSW